MTLPRHIRSHTASAAPGGCRRGGGSHLRPPTKVAPTTAPPPRAPVPREWGCGAGLGRCSVLKQLQRPRQVLPPQQSLGCLAAYHNHQSLLALLLAHGADPNKQHKDGLSPSGVAIYRGHLSLLREVLLPHPRLDVDARDDAGGRTALIQAAYWGKTEAVQLLLREKREGGGGAEPMVLTKMATCAFQVARVKGHVGCVMLLEVRAEWRRGWENGRVRSK